MSAPKLYLISIQNKVVDKVTTYREIDVIQQAWNINDVGEKVGILHCGFSRPKLPVKIELPNFVKGKVIYTGSLKWGLPDFFKSTSQPIAHIELDARLTPCYLALDQWGYEAIDEFDSDQLSLNLLTDHNENKKDTISLAAQQVLNDANNHPLNKEEIYARIIESNYYHFNTPTPVHVLDVTLNRETVGTDYSKAAKVPVFGKNKEGCYYLLGDKSAEPKGWIQVLSIEDSELYEKIHELGVSDDEGYLSIRNELSKELNVSIDKIRFELLKPTIENNNPYELLRIAPLWIIEENIDFFGFTVRVRNALLSAGITMISELAEMKLDKLKKLPNMGKRSINDIYDAIIEKIGKSTLDFSNASKYKDLLNKEAENDLVPFADQITQLPLRQHLDRTLDELSEVDRLVLHGRLGYKGKVLTLEEIAEKLDVTRERIRQRQKKYVEKIIVQEYWDDVIGIRIGQLLLDRDEPLILEMLEIEDAWFEGFMDAGYIYLSNVIQMFSENAVQVIEAQGRNVITRINKKTWDQLIRDVKNSLKQKADLKEWTRADVNQYFESCLAEHSAKELLSLLCEAVCDFLQFENDSMNAILLAYGRSAESAVAAVLAQAEGPLHFTEIAKRASDILGKQVEERRAHGAVKKEGVWQYDRGTYGLIDHCPIPESKRKSICQIVEHLLYLGPINRQWHSKEIIDQLKESFPGIPDELDPYVLRMSIEGSNKINFLNRMVWARSDSGLTANDRVEVAEAFIQILEDAGEPLTGNELKKRLSEIRGVNENMQIHMTDRMILLGPDYWGLIDRDISGDKKGNNDQLNALYQCLKETQKGIHVSEVETCLLSQDVSSNGTTSYELLNLAQRDDRFYLGRGMYLALAEWNGDIRRLNISQSVRRVLETMVNPMNISEISAEVEKLSGLQFDGHVTGLLLKEGAIYNSDLKVWISSVEA